MKAIDVNTFKPSLSGKINPTSLTTVEVNTATPSTTTAALSWKWDLDDNHNSKNIHTALVAAKTHGYHALLLDTISIDQSLSSCELIQQVLQFAELYSTHDVIAAYDITPCSDWLKVMRRPWLTYEIKHYMTTDNILIYAGHANDQGCCNDFGFKHMADRVMHTNLTHTLIYLLLEHVTMMDYFDIRYFFPEFANLISHLYNNLSKNDFLLTMALLSQCTIPTNRSDSMHYVNYRINGDQDLSGIRLDRYTVPNDFMSFHSTREIKLDTTTIATLRKSTANTGDHRYFLIPERDTLSIILNTFGFDASQPLGPSLHNSTSSMHNKTNQNKQIIFHNFDTQDSHTHA